MSNTPPRKHTSDHFGINQVRNHFGLPPIKYEKKPCITCKEPMISEWKGHRMCNRCNAYAVKCQQQGDE